MVEQLQNFDFDKLDLIDGFWKEILRKILIKDPS